MKSYGKKAPWTSEVSMKRSVTVLGAFAVMLMALVRSIRVIKVFFIVQRYEKYL